MKVQEKLAAGISLCMMGIGFMFTLPFQNSPIGQLLAGAFEAGLVGGLADWFAVTALFRHPLGIPIPHTALLPANRAKMTDALVSAVEDHLLNKESISIKLMQMRPVERILDSISKEQITRFMEFLRENFLNRVQGMIRSADLSALILELVKDETKLSHAFDFVIERAEERVITLEARKRFGQWTIEAVHSIEKKGFLQVVVHSFLSFWDENKLGETVQQVIRKKIHSLKTDGHPDRLAVISFLQKEITNIAQDPDLNRKVKEQLSTWLEQWIHGNQPSALLEKFIDEVRKDEALLARCNEALQQAIVGILEDNHSKIGSLVRENIEKMDNAELIRLIEEKVGKDLQWIRVNGAVCGFILGLILTAIRIIFG